MIALSFNLFSFVLKVICLPFYFVVIHDSINFETPVSVYFPRQNRVS